MRKWYLLYRYSFLLPGLTYRRQTHDPYVAQQIIRNSWNQDPCVAMSASHLKASLMIRSAYLMARQKCVMSPEWLPSLPQTHTVYYHIMESRPYLFNHRYPSTGKIMSLLWLKRGWWWAADGLYIHGTTHKVNVWNGKYTQRGKNGTGWDIKM